MKWTCLRKMQLAQANRSCFLGWENSHVQTHTISLITIWSHPIWQAVLPPCILPSFCKCLRRNDEGSIVENYTRAIMVMPSIPVSSNLV